MFRPGLYQVPRTTFRHYPILAAAFTVAALIAGAVVFTVPHLSHAATRQMAVIRPVIRRSPVQVQPQLPADSLRAMLAAQAAQRAAPTHYRVRAGDTLSLIAHREYGRASRWPALWWVNRHKVHNPTALRVGMTLTLSGWHPAKAWLTRRAMAAMPQPAVQQHAAVATSQNPVPVTSAAPVSGIYSFTALEALWVSAGGPASAEAAAASIAECESGGNPQAFNPSGASGLWQILGQVVSGDIFDPMVNALNAVSKFHASGDTFAQWVCQP